MKKVILVLVVIVSAVFVSCNSGNEQANAEIKKVDSLMALVDSADAILKSVQSDTVIAQIMKQIKEGVNPADTDSLSSKFGAFMDTKKFFVKKLNNKLGEIAANVDYTKQQLTNLKHDIPLLIKQGEHEKVKKFVSDEAKATSIIIQKTNELKQMVERNKKAFFELKEK